MAEFRMPSLGADMDVGTVVEWLVNVGDEVHRGDIVAVVETEKSTIEVEVFDAGTVEEILVESGTEVAVGTPLARIGAPSVPLPHPPAASEPVAPEPVAREASAPEPAGGRILSPLVRHLADREHVDLTTVSGSGRGGRITRHDVEAKVHPPPAAPGSDRVRASPLARRVAAERGIDLDGRRGTGPSGAVVAADLAAAPPAPPATRPPRPGDRTAPAARKAPAGRRAPNSSDRKSRLLASLGALMGRSKREIPHYYLSTTIDMAEPLRRLTDANAGRPVADRILPAAALLHATVAACRDVPAVNGHWIDGAFRPSDEVHLGVAVSLRGGGLIAPALRDAQDLSLGELMARLRQLVGRARAGTLRSSEMTDPTITVTNLGDQGVESVFGVIYPPQVAIVGFGRIVERPWAERQMLTVRPVVTATLSADHRVTDGHDGARFLAAVDRHLHETEQP